MVVVHRCAGRELHLWAHRCPERECYATMVGIHCVFATRDGHCPFRKSCKMCFTASVGVQKSANVLIAEHYPLLPLRQWHCDQQSLQADGWLDFTRPTCREHVLCCLVAQHHLQHGEPFQRLEDGRVSQDTCSYDVSHSNVSKMRSKGS